MHDWMNHVGTGDPIPPVYILWHMYFGVPFCLVAINKPGYLTIAMCTFRLSNSVIWLITICHKWFGINPQGLIFTLEIYKYCGYTSSFDSSDE